MKYSIQREALLTLLRSTRSHPTADWLYQELRKDFPNISLGTVYRNLALLSEKGEILSLNVNSEKEHFDGFTHEHYHFVCSDCGTITDVDVPSMPELNDSVERQTGAEVDKYSLVFYGKCMQCR